jgi:multidrug efflux system membrane fusion protein
MASLALSVSILSGCSAAPLRRGGRVPITVAAVERRSVPFEIEATGTVEPAQSAQVTAQVGGLVTRVGFREGDEVVAGQVLIELDRRSFEAVAERAAALLARDRAQARSAQLDHERAETLAAQQLISAGELDQKRAAAAAMVATVRADSATLEAARLDLANATVRAPIAGRTGDLSVNVGDVVRSNDAAAPLVTINQLRPIRVRFTATQADMPELRRQMGHPLRVDVAPADRDSTWIEGRLVFVDNAVDPATGTLLLKAEFANRDGALWPGAFVRVRLRLYEQDGATVVPVVAVTNSQSGPYCFVVKPDTTVEARPVSVERTWRDLAVIASGVQAGETVVTDGQLRLETGAKAVIRGGGPTRASLQ